MKLLIIMLVLAAGSSAAQDFPPPPPDVENQEAQESSRPSGNPDSGQWEVQPQTGTVGAIQPESSAARPRAPGAPKRKAKLSPALAKITVRLSDVPLSAFLKAITQQTSVNFIVSEGLEQKRITAFLEEVPLEQALRVLLGIKGLTYEEIPGRSYTYLITTRKETQPRTITRIFELNYIPLRDIQVGELVGEDSSSTSGGVETSGGQSAQGQPAQRSEAGVSTPGQSILSILRTLLSAFGRVAVDDRTNSLIITDLPERFPEIESLIRELDRKTPQVSIEIQIVEINSDGLTKLGIEFGGSGGELIRFIGPVRETDWPLRPSNLPELGPRGSELGHFFPPRTITAGQYDPQTNAKITVGSLSMAEFNVLLRAIVTKTRGKIVARPRVTTINNKPAEIRVTRNQAIGQNSTTVGAAAATTSSTERQQTGLILRVIPQINGDGYITMVVEPKLTRVVDSLVGTGTKDPITRAAKTMIRVRNGDTIVLGGLLDTREEKTIRKVPILGDIPIIGWILFRSQSTQKLNSELAIFLTPTILEN
ncbi:MAG: hypothetical protein HY401_09300 [Elusimicrobia bacterium]|nr:hypothetical protein [Elusimicrobiota bacterium]